MSGLQLSFFDRLQHAFGKEYAAFVAVAEHSALCLFPFMAAEILFVVDEIHLKPFPRDRCDFDDQRLVDVIDYQVHPRKADHFVQLMPALVDIAVARHEDTHLAPRFLHQTGDFKRYVGSAARGHIRHQFRRNVQYPLVFHYIIFNKTLTRPLCVLSFGTLAVHPRDKTG